MFANAQPLEYGLQSQYVNTSRGNLTFLRKDLVLIGRQPLSIARVYDSANLTTNDFGPGWQLYVNGKAVGLTGSGSSPIEGVTFSYTQNKLSRISGPNNQVINIERNDQGRINKITDHHGRAVHYDYSKKGWLTEVTDIGGQVWRYDYLGTGLLKSITDPKGHEAARFSYDNNRRVKQTRIRSAWQKYAYFDSHTLVTDDNKNQTRFDFNLDGITTKVTNAEGFTSEVTLDEHNRPTQL